MNVIALEDIKVFDRVGLKYIIDKVQRDCIMDGVTVLSEILYSKGSGKPQNIFK